MINIRQVWVDGEFGEMSSSWQGRAQLTGAACWYSTRVFLIHICNVEQCSKLFRQGSSRLLFGSNLAYHDNFIIGLLHRSSGLPSPCLSYSLTEFTRQSDLAAVQCSGWLWWLGDISKLNYRCCWHQTTVTPPGRVQAGLLWLSSPPLSAVIM